MTHQAKAQMRSRLDLPRRARALRVLAGTGIRLVLQLTLSLTRPLFVVPPRLRTGPTVLSTLFCHGLSLFFLQEEEISLSHSLQMQNASNHDFGIFSIRS